MPPLAAGAIFADPRLLFENAFPNSLTEVEIADDGGATAGKDGRLVYNRIWSGH